MANAMDAYFRAKGQATSQGQNMLAAERQMKQIQRDQGLRDIISGAYDPETGMNMKNALSSMYEGGYGPEAMKIEASQAKLRGATPSMVNEYKFWSQLPKADQERYINVKRAQQIKKIGGVETVVSPISGITPLGTLEAETTAKLKTKEAEVLGRELGTEKALLANLEASLPNLQSVVGKLGELGKIATYTKAGQFKDVAARQAGLKMGEGAIARKEYISMVNNEILPLLKQTFGAAFTEKEGETLKATLGDPNASPEEKDAVLKSFINSKIAEIETKRRRVGQQTVAPQQPAAPQAAIDYLMKNNNPVMQQQFKAKYGYLP